MQNAFLTGCSRGIGASALSLFLNQGWNVTGVFNKTAPQIDGYVKQFNPVKADLSSEQEVYALKKYFTNNIPVDVLVNNAGVFYPASFQVSDEEWNENWNKTLQVNLNTSTLLSKWFIESCIKAGRQGIIINVSSRAAYRGETADYPAYAASKAAMIAITKTIARGYGKDSIYAYSIAPGFVETDMARESIDVYGKEYLTKGLVLNDIVPPEEVGKLILTLAKGDFKHMTGQTFHINSGSYLI